MSNQQIFFINSRDRMSGTDSDFYINLPEIRSLDATHACLMQAYIPRSFYTFSSGQNTFTLEEDGKTATITVTAGSYNKNNLRTNLTTLLNAASPNGYTYAIALPASSAPETGKYTFSVTGNGAVQPSFIFESDCYEQLGFNKDSTNVFVADSLVSTNVFNLQPENTIYIKSDLVQDSNNVLQEVLASSLNFSNISFTQQNVEYNAKPLLNKDSSSIRFYISDENGKSMSLNGLNCVFSVLLFKPIDKRNAILNVLNSLKK